MLIVLETKGLSLARAEHSPWGRGLRVPSGAEDEALCWANQKSTRIYENVYKCVLPPSTHLVCVVTGLRWEGDRPLSLELGASQLCSGVQGAPPVLRKV